jgi:predicted O-linked N-acetylglucosamine transferase (SPINDLY family)
MSTLSPSAQIAYYETAIAEANTASNYWWLGISYLLADDLDSAQATWFEPITNADDDLAVDLLTKDLADVLLVAAAQQTELKNYPGALLLRQQYQEIDDTCLENILQLILLTDCCDRLQPEQILAWQIDRALTLTTAGEIDQALLNVAFSKMLLVINPENSSQILACLSYSDRPEELIDLLLKQGFGGGFPYLPECGLSFGESCLEIFPQHLGLLHYLSVTYPRFGRFTDSTITAQRYYEACSSDLTKVRGYYLWIRALLEASDFEKVAVIMPDYRNLVAKIVQNPPPEIDLDACRSLVSSASYFPYLQDCPRENHAYQNQVGQLYQACLQSEIEPENPTAASEDIKPVGTDIKHVGTLRIGYIGSTLRAHSVGWLSRWLWQHHDHEKFQIFTYAVGTPPTDSFNGQWFGSKSDNCYYLNTHPGEIVDLIRHDQIDILVDVDSLTSSLTYEVMARRPAPVQITWLGWDASGCSAIDYFIADPYVLPANAGDYYSEKIWRLPATYIAVDGFEVGIPTLRRADLDIAPEAIVYLSTQQGYKLNAANILAQMQIVKQVPNSYLLIKNRVDEETAHRLYAALAEQIGLDWSQIRFIGKDHDELTHRANLLIADVVLDTFPYNGATTTLETLWMGVPMVTTVGEQFAARNSYAFMTNAGITAGIAHSIEEYIAWGIKLGTDAELRQQVTEQLLNSRHTSPLWNARNFTLEMEKAYGDMWAIYQQIAHSLDN